MIVSRSLTKKNIRNRLELCSYSKKGRASLVIKVGADGQVEVEEKVAEVAEAKVTGKYENMAISLTIFFNAGTELKIPHTLYYFTKRN